MIDVVKLMGCLRELADLEFQRCTWLAVEGPAVSSFSEMVSQTFDDSGLTDSIDADHCPRELDDEAFLALKILDGGVSKIDQALRPEAQLEDPRMEEVRRLARAALDLLEQRYG
jgi:hypothetical protein